MASGTVTYVAYDLSLYSAAEITGLFALNSCRVVDVFGDFGGSSLSKERERMIFIADKSR